MGALLESGLVGNIGLKHLKVIKEDTINKWDKLGFLEGLKGHLRENVAQLYENQASFLINEATSDGSSGSAVNLMESKTYENPQFLRMKDLMTKMNVVK